MEVTIACARLSDRRDINVNNVQWNFDLTNLYITKSSIKRTIFFTPVIVKYMKNNLDITKPRPERTDLER